ncbi:MAG: hypothetical protein AAF492_09815, partial [Verrucomicrobiota bacterium]
MAEAAPKDWHLPKAPIRFALKLNNNPTHNSCGYFVQIPDGGVLPRPYPRSVVVDGSGKEIKSYALWQNPETGIGIVFEAPKNKKNLYVYFVAAPQLNLWSPSSGLTPSALLCTQPGGSGKSAAAGLGQFGSVSRSVHYRNRPGSGKAPLSVPGDLTGRPGPCALYMLAYLNVADSGSTWVAPLRFDGGAEVRVNGRVLIPKKINEKPGGVGAAFDLPKGLNRFEIFAWAGNSNSRNGLMTLIWKTPKTTMKELGGQRPSDLRYPGESMWEARPLRNNEIARSGGASVTSAQMKDGGPVARIGLSALENFWLGNEKPLFVYKLNAISSGNPGNTKYTWNFGGGSSVTKPDTTWLFPGLRENTVMLTAESGGKKSVAKVPFWPFTTKKTNMNDARCRENFRQAALDVLEAYPAGVDPTANWGASHWNNLFRNMELGEGQALLNHIFRARWDVVEKKLSPKQRVLLLDIFLDYLPRTAPDMALKWTRDIATKSTDSWESGMMNIRQAEIQLYYKDDPEAAKRALQPILAKREGDDISEWARIRYADVQFVAGDLNKATKFYGDVQNRAGHEKRKTAVRRPTKPKQPEPLRGLARSKAELERQRSSGLARSKKELDAQRAKRQPQNNPTPATPNRRNGRSFELDRNSPVADWKMDALVDAAQSETVKNLIEQDFLLEAKQALRQWERSFPLSKISSDYILTEAKLYMALEDWKRAEAIL